VLVRFEPTPRTGSGMVNVRALLFVLTVHPNAPCSLDGDPRDGSPSKRGRAIFLRRRPAAAGKMVEAAGHAPAPGGNSVIVEYPHPKRVVAGREGTRKDRNGREGVSLVCPGIRGGIKSPSWRLEGWPTWPLLPCPNTRNSLGIGRWMRTWRRRGDVRVDVVGWVVWG
jgi:hypothetical protein